MHHQPKDSPNPDAVEQNPLNTSIFETATSQNKSENLSEILNTLGRASKGEEIDQANWLVVYELSNPELRFVVKKLNHFLSVDKGVIDWELLEGLFEINSTLLDRELFKPSRNLLVTLIENAERLDSLYQLARAEIELGNLFVLTEQPEKARKAFEVARNAIRNLELDEQILLAPELSPLIFIFEQNKEPWLATDLYQEILDYTREAIAEYPEDSWDSMLRVVQTSLQIHDLDLCHQTCTEMLDNKIYTQHIDNFERAVVMSLQGDAAVAAELQNAVNHYEEAIKVVANTVDERGITATNFLLRLRTKAVEEYLKTGQLETAKPHLTQLEWVLEP